MPRQYVYYLRAGRKPNNWRVKLIPVAILNETKVNLNILRKI